MKIILTLCLILVFVPWISAEEYDAYNMDGMKRMCDERLKDIVEKNKVSERQKRLAKVIKLYENAEQLYAQGKYDQAKTLYETVRSMTQKHDIRVAAKEMREKIKTGQE